MKQLAALSLLVGFAFGLVSCQGLGRFGWRRSVSDAPVVLAIAGDRFTVNGSPQFLLGASYFDARGWKIADLDGLASRQFNLIRVWLDWNAWNNRSRSFFDVDGNLLDSQILLDLVRAAAVRGIIVEATILNGSSASVRSPEPMNGIDAAVNAVRNAVRLLKDEPNVFFDLVNEHNGDWPRSHETMARLVRAALEEDPDALLTFSSYDDHLLQSETSPNPSMINEELGTGIQILTPHMGRCPNWWELTGSRIIVLKRYLQSIGRTMPIYDQEESRRKGVNCDYEPTRDNFLQSARQAREAGAAAWVFHTDAGFDLSGSNTFFGRLDSVEQETVETLANVVFGKD